MVIWQTTQEGAEADGLMSQWKAATEMATAVYGFAAALGVLGMPQ